MDTVLAALISGVSGIIVALITTLGVHGLLTLFKRREEEIPPVPPSKSTSKIPEPSWESTSKISKAVLLVLAVIGGIIGVVLWYFLAVPNPILQCPPFAPTSVTITTPTSESKVPILSTIQGTACNIPNDEELWVLVVPDGITAYYPQPGPVVLTNNGTWFEKAKWSASATIGLNSDCGRGFVLVVALANRDGSTAIQTYLSHSSAGLDPLPGGIQLISQVHVVRACVTGEVNVESSSL